jgi:small subunit ribosomal protein S1
MIAFDTTIVRVIARAAMFLPLSIRFAISTSPSRVSGIVGQLRASEIARDRVEDARAVLKAGEEVEAKVTGVDRKTRIVSLSIKAKEQHDEAQAVQSYKTESGRSSSGTTLGDLLKEQMNPD